MNNAIWLSYSQVLWYFSTLIVPFGHPLLTTMPAAGALCLIVGLVLAIRQRNRAIAIMALSPVLTHVFVFIAGLMRGQMSGIDSNTPVMIFFAAQLLLLAYLWWRCRRTPLQASLFTVFGATYAIFGAFLASMSLSDIWL